MYQKRFLSDHVSPTKRLFYNYGNIRGGPKLLHRTGYMSIHFFRIRVKIQEQDCSYDPPLGTQFIIV